MCLTELPQKKKKKKKSSGAEKTGVGQPCELCYLWTTVVDVELLSAVLLYLMTLSSLLQKVQNKNRFKKREGDRFENLVEQYKKKLLGSGNKGAAIKRNKWFDG